MFENMTFSQMMGLVVIFLSFGAFILIIITLKTKRFVITGLQGWLRQRRGEDLLIKQEEHPKRFIYNIYGAIIVDIFLLIFGILITLGILEL